MSGGRKKRGLGITGRSKTIHFTSGLQTTPSHVSVPPNHNGTMTKDGKMYQGKYSLSVFSCDARLCEKNSYLAA